MPAEAVRKLSDDQLSTFDLDYVSDELFEHIAETLTRELPGGRFNFLDVGGGKGLFADRLLARFPESTGNVLDNSEMLLSQNTADPRKTTTLASATELTQRFAPGTFDVVFFNLSLHHFVSGGYRHTRKVQRDALKAGLAVLKTGGRLIVTEQLYDGFFLSNLPGLLIFTLTSSRAFSPIVRRFGANTAGCGVCFLSRRGWRSEFRRLGLHETSFHAQISRVASIWFWVRVRLLTVRSLSRAVFCLEHGAR
jgi:SAM-dependent methyltransferase